MHYVKGTTKLLKKELFADLTNYVNTNKPIHAFIENEITPKIDCAFNNIHQGHQLGSA